MRGRCSVKTPAFFNRNLSRRAAVARGRNRSSLVPSPHNLSSAGALSGTGSVGDSAGDGHGGEGRGGGGGGGAGGGGRFFQNGSHALDALDVEDATAVTEAADAVDATEATHDSPADAAASQGRQEGGNGQVAGEEGGNGQVAGEGAEGEAAEEDLSEEEKEEQSKEADKLEKWLNVRRKSPA